MRAFAIDFYNCSTEHFRTLLDFNICMDGQCNAVAFWFDLQLDEQTVLSSGPDPVNVSPQSAFIGILNKHISTTNCCVVT